MYRQAGPRRRHQGSAKPTELPVCSRRASSSSSTSRPLPRSAWTLDPSWCSGRRGDPVNEEALATVPEVRAADLTVVGGMLIVSGVIGVYFSWRETERTSSPCRSRRRRARRRDRAIHRRHRAPDQLGRACRRPAPDGDALEERRFEYPKLFKQVSAITEVAWINADGSRAAPHLAHRHEHDPGQTSTCPREPKFREAVRGPHLFRPGLLPSRHRALHDDRAARRPAAA